MGFVDVFFVLFLTDGFGNYFICWRFSLFSRDESCSDVRIIRTKMIITEFIIITHVVAAIGVTVVIAIVDTALSSPSWSLLSSPYCNC